MKSLFEISKSVLKRNISGLRDIGSVPAIFIIDLLTSIPAIQLKELELNSPQLQEYTSAIWKSLCVRDFVSIRILVEDNKLKEEPESWREVYLEEEIKQEEKMARVVGKMRAGYDKALDRATTMHFDGVIAEKKRKITVHRVPAAKSSDSLFSKVRAESKRIASNFSTPSIRSKPTTFASAFPSTSSSTLNSRPPPIRATAFSTSGGGFILPRKNSTPSLSTSSSFSSSSKSTTSSRSNNPIKVVTRTVLVKVPISSSSTNGKGSSLPRRINGLPSSTKAIPTHSPRSTVIPRSSAVVGSSSNSNSSLLQKNR